ncbi:DUF4185 domain-containing protein, partial [Enterococcus faecalis]|uniref:DUF4185 domain-containing protein n=1 Tax=Enterococcus faecalis TaxID=1351 RepID=UPI001C267F63
MELGPRPILPERHVPADSGRRLRVRFRHPRGALQGADKSGVYLRRCHWKHLWERSKWEFWGWTGSRWEWGTKVWPTPILKPFLPGGSIGEINAQWLGGKVRLTYMDGML